MGLQSILDMAWLGGTALCLGGLAYGALLVYEFHTRATEAVQRAVARLALHDSAHYLTLPEGEKVARP